MRIRRGKILRLGLKGGLDKYFKFSEANFAVSEHVFSVFCIQKAQSARNRSYLNVGNFSRT